MAGFVVQTTTDDTPNLHPDYNKHELTDGVLLVYEAGDTMPATQPESVYNWDHCASFHVLSDEEMEAVEEMVQ